MKILGTYKDKTYRSLRVDSGAMVAIELSSAIMEGYSDDENNDKFYVAVRSGCYIFHIMTSDGEYYDKNQAAELIRKIATEEIVILDDINMALYDAIDTTPEEYCIRNAVDYDYEEIPLKITT